MGDSEEASRIRRFLEPSSDVIAGITAVGISALVGDRSGVVAAAAQPIVTRIIRGGVLDMVHRQMSRQEQGRSGAVAIVATERVEKMLRLGHELRHDDFFSGEPGNRSFAEEIVEGTLLAAQREHEERKLLYLGNLLASFAFHEEISRGGANFLLKLADDLSYRQLCLLALADRKDEFPSLRDGTFEELEKSLEQGNAPENAVELFTILEEAEGLTNLGMLGQRVQIFMGHGVGFNPAQVQPQRWGGVLNSLMALHEMPTTELEPLAKILSS